MFSCHTLPTVRSLLFKHDVIGHLKNVKKSKIHERYAELTHSVHRMFILNKTKETVVYVLYSLHALVCVTDPLKYCVG